ncbi:ammonium transporter AmtB-like domain-containing protein [Aspergillus pseudotamarii]|uniref:Ammonium transporter n=3 Tax=Aspergillus subgen. Circumdati TaxID=2720871 RepID=A0A5N7A2Z0_9EURO|nr:ammonium transporter AmtB-like domain-containing protein [Aspergillus pseudotamarii]XP_031927318.1 ammonium transporter AmtB-like domain-containing protein [Aspergillus caelatus]KAE8133212.1 ammonium transporter AmtB-like domain-containing protein [Aspergillus pseudotamarii]KAE8364237.1 ammonium transporter AmtB-like domain-containing protein [Aspergillus caelatus]KAE8416683.1 ammonium transporter AmtB-like domain-containing protein [Aspergillus pseudocaelatus]
MAEYPVAYNGSATGTGGDSLTEDLNIYYSSGDIAWVIVSTALVLLMIPGVGFFYSGLARRKSALSLLWLSMMSVGIVSFQWFFWGYSLAFSHTAGKYIGDLNNFGFKGVLGAPSVGSDKVPDLLFAVFQGMFACITVALAVGAVAERGRMLPCMVFSFVWSTIIYDPLACWTWNSSGWVANLGGLDFAGGTPVHIASGCTALAYSLMLGKRRGHGTHELNYRPHNVTHVVIGTVFLWVGWFGFNAGSALSANLRAVMAAVVTNLAAAVGGVTWCLLDYRLERKWSTVGFCSGVIAGLVAITPASGFVTPWASFIFGVVGAVACNYATKLKYVIKVDDALDIFAVHGIGGLVGNLLTGLFAADYIAHLDGSTTIDGGWINHNYIQLAYQLADSVTGMAYSFFGSCIILFIINLIPGLSLRAPEEDEIMGIDDAEIGEFAYDYVEITRDVISAANSENGEAASKRSLTPTGNETTIETKA